MDAVINQFKLDFAALDPVTTACQGPPPRIAAAPVPQASTTIEEALEAGPHNVHNLLHLIPNHVIRNALKALVLFRRFDGDGRAQMSWFQLGRFILPPGSTKTGSRRLHTLVDESSMDRAGHKHQPRTNTN